MRAIKQQCQNQGFLSQVDDKLGSDENINSEDFNDEQEGKMITHEDRNHNDSQRGRIAGKNKGSINNISQTFNLSLASSNLSSKQQRIINLTDVTLKSTIVCLLLLSMIMVGVYKMIEQVYEIQHPQLVIEKRLTSNRMNMVRQQNSLSKVTQHHSNQDQNIVVNKDDKESNLIKDNKDEQAKKIGSEKVELEKKGLKQSQAVQIKQQGRDSKSLQLGNIEKTQQVPKQQQHLQVGLIKTQQSQVQIIQPKTNNPSEQIKTQTNEHQQSALQQLIRDEHQDNRQQVESQLRQKEQFIENYQLKSDQKQQDQQKQANVMDKQDDQVGVKEQVKLQQAVEKDQVLTEQKQVPKLPEKPQPPKIQQRVPPRTPQRPNPPHKPQQQQPVKPFQPAQRPANPPPILPTAKANISRQQAIKWRQYEKMIDLPLQKQASSNKMLMQEYQYYEKKYNISKYNQLPICVVVPTYNNVQDNRYQDNLKSILQQNYTNYHVVIIDDKSSDNTGEKINQYLTTLNPKFSQKIKVIINQQRKMAMPNLRYAAMNECKENQLFIIVDGDDLLIGRQVFKLFSAVMQQRDYWVMWTNFLSPKGAIGYSRQYPAVHKESNNYRKAGFVMSHLRAYYTKLFRLIKQQDLKDQKGQYFHAANDVAIGVPILEMAHKHVGYVPELSYFYNMYTGLNNHKVRLRQQKANDKLIRKKPRYQALKSLDFQNSQQK